MTQSPDQKLEALGYSFQKRLTPGAIYRPVVVDGTTAYVSGCVPFDGDKNLVSKGKVPSQINLDEARKAAALCMANVLRLLHQELGTLDRIERPLKVTGFVNSDPDFTEQHLVVNGASQLLLDVFGDAGWHARSAVGLAALPLGASVEVEAILSSSDLLLFFSDFFQGQRCGCERGGEITIINPTCPA